MLRLEAYNIRKSFGDRQVIAFDQLKIDSDDKIGLVGINGAGKTTLLNILAGRLEPDEGKVKLHGQLAYLTQLEEPSDQAPAGEAAVKLGVSHQSPALSGGEQARLKLAQCLSQPSHLLLADEPTANLDLAGISLVEETLLAYPGALLLISHDRALLDKVCHKILALENGRLNAYPGNYTAYQRQKQQQEARQQFEYEEYQREKKKLDAARQEKARQADRIKSTPSRMGNSEARLHKRGANSKRAKIAKAAKSIESRLERLLVKEKPSAVPVTQMNIQDGSKLYAKFAIKIANLRHEFPGRPLFDGISLVIPTGSRTVLLGNNGTGKTTLLRLIMKPADGIEISAGARIGYYSQNLDILDPGRTILENVMATSAYPAAFVRILLARLLFRRDEVHKPVDRLSGGERVKTALAKVFAQATNILLLDEPTNYLDVFSQEALEKVLLEYFGTLLVASHDRRFVERVADQLIILQEGQAKVFAGGYQEFLVAQAGKRAGVDERENYRRQLENRLAELIGRLSLPSRQDDVPALDLEYQRVLRELKSLRI